jgi:uncharacterized membrane protein
VASEIGKAFGGVPRALPSLRLLSPGDPGGVTALGLAAGIGAACAMATAAVALVPGFTARLIGDVVVAATLGAGVESLLAGWLEPDGFVNNDVLNLVNTAVAAVVAVSLGG